MRFPPDEPYLPCGWRCETDREDRIAFTRKQGDLTLVAERTGESGTLTRLCTGPVWRLRCEQRAGEAESGIHVGCVTTMNTAMETLLTYMRRITEAAETNEGPSVATVLELLRVDPDPDGGGRNGTPPNQLGTQPPRS